MKLSKKWLLLIYLINVKTGVHVVIKGSLGC